ncbi:hypothetical protein SASPL_120833 [Salvia splendens]|uniref:Nodulin homeobox N-terminal domain-containing protein n=1 Tax=Salvia splendens TaxID=180675 RepID=A0A8X8XTT5_SALSN|nr:hypothetical protein SASPL_120833 [Salvia splendens]
MYLLLRIQEYHTIPNAMVLLHSALVDIFIEAEFAAVCVDVKFLQTNDSFGSAFPTTEETLNHICQSVILSSISTLLHLCEAESVSYLEEVASKTSTQDVAKSDGLKVLVSKVKASCSSGSCVAKKMFNAPSEASYPKGQLELNAMRLADCYGFHAMVSLLFMIEGRKDFDSKHDI